MNPGDAHLLELLDEHTEVAFGELLRAFETSREELLELMAWGVVEPRRADRAQSGFIDEDAWRFSSRALVVAHRAARLRRVCDAVGDRTIAHGDGARPLHHTGTPGTWRATIRRSASIVTGLAK